MMALCTLPSLYYIWTVLHIKLYIFKTGIFNISQRNILELRFPSIVQGLMQTKSDKSWGQWCSLVWLTLNISWELHTCFWADHENKMFDAP